MPPFMLLLLAAWLGVGTVQDVAWCDAQRWGIGSYDPERSEISLGTEPSTPKVSPSMRWLNTSCSYAVQHVI